MKLRFSKIFTTYGTTTQKMAEDQEKFANYASVKTAMEFIQKFNFKKAICVAISKYTNDFYLIF